MPNTMPLGKGTSDANRFAVKKQAAVKRFIKFLVSLDELNPGEIISVFDEVKKGMLACDTSETARRVHSELGRIL